MSQVRMQSSSKRPARAELEKRAESDESLSESRSLRSLRADMTSKNSAGSLQDFNVLRQERARIVITEQHAKLDRQRDVSSSASSIAATTTADIVETVSTSLDSEPSMLANHISEEDTDDNEPDFAAQRKVISTVKAADAKHDEHNVKPKRSSRRRRSADVPRSTRRVPDRKRRSHTLKPQKKRGGKTAKQKNAARKSGQGSRRSERYPKVVLPSKHTRYVTGDDSSIDFDPALATPRSLATPRVDVPSAQASITSLAVSSEASTPGVKSSGSPLYSNITESANSSGFGTHAARTFVPPASADDWRAFDVDVKALQTSAPSPKDEEEDDEKKEPKTDVLFHKPQLKASTLRSLQAARKKFPRQYDTLDSISSASTSTSRSSTQIQSHSKPLRRGQHSAPRNGWAVLDVMQRAKNKERRSRIPVEHTALGQTKSRSAPVIEATSSKEDESIKTRSKKEVKRVHNIKPLGRRASIKLARLLKPTASVLAAKAAALEQRQQLQARGRERERREKMLQRPRGKARSTPGSPRRVDNGPPRRSLSAPLRPRVRFQE